MSTLRHSALALSAFLGVSLFAQVQVDKSILLEGSAPEQRQVLGLPPANLPTDALDATTQQSGSHSFANIVVGDLWDINLPAAPGAPTPGLEVVVRVPIDANGAISVLINGIGPYAVVVMPGQPLFGNAIAAGSMASLVFSGTNFQVVNSTTHVRRTCPVDMVQVGDHYCIDPQQTTDTTTFFTAAVNCISQGKRLCTWGEWAAACVLRNSLGLQEMVGDWEWTNDASNEDHSVRIVGNVNCSSATNRDDDGGTPHVSRCCYSR